MCLLYSKFHKDDYDIVIEAWGDGTLPQKKVNRLIEIRKEYVAECRANPVSISLQLNNCNAGFTDIAPKFLEQIDELRELILPDTVTKLNMTPKLEHILKRNKTLIRGSFDSFAEQFAHEHGLRFRPADFDFYEDYCKLGHETTTRKMKFRRDGSIYFRTESWSPGSSAGNTFGGYHDTELPHHFFQTMTFDQFLARFHELAAKIIVDYGKMAEFFEKAKTHDAFWGRNE